MVWILVLGSCASPELQDTGIGCDHPPMDVPLTYTPHQWQNDITSHIDGLIGAYWCTSVDTDDPIHLEVTTPTPQRLTQAYSAEIKGECFEYIHYTADLLVVFPRFFFILTGTTVATQYPDGTFKTSFFGGPVNFDGFPGNVPLYIAETTYLNAISRDDVNAPFQTITLSLSKPESSFELICSR